MGGSIPRKKRMALISQSTQPPWKFEKLAAFMVSRAHELKIVNTVCPVTIRRQEDTLEPAREVDLMVVVGGRSSANTKELTRLCEIAGTPAIQIEGVRDLTDPSRRSTAPRSSGVTGGTSTPIEDLRDVAERILELAGTPETQRRRRTSLADAALDAAATPAGRTTSLPNPSARRRRRRGLTVAVAPRRARPPGRRHRRPPERRQEHAVQPHRRAAHGDRRGPRAHHARPALRRRRVERPAVRRRRHRRPRARPGRPDRGAGPGAGSPGDRRGRRHRVRRRCRRPA